MTNIVYKQLKYYLSFLIELYNQHVSFKNVTEIIEKKNIYNIFILNVFIYIFYYIDRLKVPT